MTRCGCFAWVYVCMQVHTCMHARRLLSTRMPPYTSPNLVSSGHANPPKLRRIRPIIVPPVTFPKSCQSLCRQSDPCLPANDIPAASQVPRHNLPKVHQAVVKFCREEGVDFHEADMYDGTAEVLGHCEKALCVHVWVCVSVGECMHVRTCATASMIVCG
jgi:hypothetical protein